MLSTQQIGRAGELLVQYRLLKEGIESALLTTDAGVDLVTFSTRKQVAITIQVKTNEKPHPGGGKGKLAVGWWFPEEATADLLACVDLSQERIWIFKASEIPKLAQQHSGSRYHLWMWDDPTVRVREQGVKKFSFEFQGYLLENRIHDLL